MLQRVTAHSILTIKSVDAEKRLISGVATTPEVDRVGDVVVSTGARFKNPLPLLLYHDSRMPVGTVRLSKPTSAGVEFEAQLPDITEDGSLKERVAEAWQSIKAGLIRGVSIGFRAMDDGVELLESGGLKFTDFEILELSLVAIPANASARISTIKQYDAIGRAALGLAAASSSSTFSGVSEPTRTKTVRRDTGMKKTYAEQVQAFEATRKAKTDRIDEIQAKVSEEGRTKDDAEREEFDTLTAEVKSIDREIADLKALERETIAKATAVTTTATTVAKGAEARGGVAVRVESTMPADVEFGAAVLCQAAAFVEMQKGNFVSPLQIAKRRYPDNARIHAFLETKANVAGGTTTDSNFASALLAPAQVLQDAFLNYLRPFTLVDRFGSTQFGAAVPSLLRVPFNVKIQSQTSGASGGWVGEGKGKPVTKFNTTSTTLLFTKVAAISVITEELARFSRPGAETLVRNELAKAVIAKMDNDFIDPAISSSAGVRPASITNGVTPLSTAGTSAANVITDVQNLVSPFLVNNYDVTNLVLLMPNTLALVLSLMQNSLGQNSFPQMSAQGGRLAGIPVLASQYLANTSSYGNMVVCVSAENIALADDGNVTVDASREAAIEMSDAPANEATTPTMSSSMVSMWQTNSIALRAEREISWAKLRSTAVTFMDDVNWGSVGSPA